MIFKINIILLYAIANVIAGFLITALSRVQTGLFNHYPQSYGLGIISIGDYSSDYRKRQSEFLRNVVN